MAKHSGTACSIISLTCLKINFHKGDRASTHDCRPHPSHKPSSRQRRRDAFCARKHRVISCSWCSGVCFASGVLSFQGNFQNKASGASTTTDKGMQHCWLLCQQQHCANAICCAIKASWYQCEQHCQQQHCANATCCASKASWYQCEQRCQQQHCANASSFASSIFVATNS